MATKLTDEGQVTVPKRVQEQVGDPAAKSLSDVPPMGRLCWRRPRCQHLWIPTDLPSFGGSPVLARPPMKSWPCFAVTNL
jgi:hypothetical protein